MVEGWKKAYSTIVCPCFSVLPYIPVTVESLSHADLQSKGFDVG
jgi:hypothetical protein